MCATSPCSTCPSHLAPAPVETAQDKAIKQESDEVDRLFDELTDLPCCGNAALCGSLTCDPKTQDLARRESSDVVEVLPMSVPSGVRTIETVPCNEAWKVLKSHPNIAFASKSIRQQSFLHRFT